LVSGFLAAFLINQVLLKGCICPDKDRIEINKNNKKKTALKYWDVNKADFQRICCNPFSSLNFM